MSDRVQVPWLCAYPVEIPGQGVIACGELAWLGKHEAAASDHWGGPVKLEDLPKAELEELAEQRGIDPSGKTKATLATDLARGA